MREADCNDTKVEVRNGSKRRKSSGWTGTGEARRERLWDPRRLYQVTPTLVMNQSRTVTLEKTLRKEGSGKK